MKKVSVVLVILVMLISACGDKNVCSVKGCGQPTYQDGLCSDHLKEKTIKDAANKVADALTETKSKNKTCKVNGCDNKVYEDGYCKEHYQEYLDQQLESAKSDLAKAIFG